MRNDEKLSRVAGGFYLFALGMSAVKLLPAPAHGPVAVVALTVGCTLTAVSVWLFRHHP